MWISEIIQARPRPPTHLSTARSTLRCPSMPFADRVFGRCADLSATLQTMGANLFRYKGVLSVAGMKQKFVFQGVGMLFSGGFVQAEWADDEVRECRFVFIGRDLDKTALLDGFMACKCSETLRFKIGDVVEAKVGKGPNGYSLGKIIRCWDDGNAYRIELQDGKKTNVWGPVDEDMYVKATGGDVVTMG